MLARTEIHKVALGLSAEERIELVAALWDSLEPEEVPVAGWQLELVRDRVAALDRVPLEERSVPWDTARRRIFADDR